MTKSEMVEKLVAENDTLKTRVADLEAELDAAKTRIAALEAAGPGPVNHGTGRN